MIRTKRRLTGRSRAEETVQEIESRHQDESHEQKGSKREQELRKPFWKAFFPGKKAFQEERLSEEKKAPSGHFPEPSNANYTNMNRRKQGKA
jgi:hypothetical protein